jgi:hypothetical protein
MEYLITMKKCNSSEDRLNGMTGVYSVKQVIVDCDENAIEEQVSEKGWEVEKVEEYQKIQKENFHNMVKWLFHAK